MLTAALSLAVAVGAVLPPTAWDGLPSHPRLFATAARWAEVGDSLATDPVAARLAALVQSRADALLAMQPVAYAKRDRGEMSGSMLEPAREAQARILALAMAARLTDSVRHRERAVVEMRALAALPDWNPAVFLDTAEATLGMAVGYDWLYDQLTAADRDAFAEAIITHGLRASIDSPAKYLGWVKGTNNWNQVCHGALVAGALAVADREPELARTVVQRAIDELHRAAAAYDPDGAFPEGPMYWSYGTSFHVILLAALETALGERYGLDAFPGFLATADYLPQVTGPTGQTFNYSDSNSSRGFEPAMFWFARRRHEPGLAAWDAAFLLRSDPSKNVRLARFAPLGLFWWQPSEGATAAPARPLSWHADGVVPLASHRSAWDDPAATWVAIKGGRARTSHGHMDAGSFVLEADGVRWAVDPGMQGYDSLYKAGLSRDLWKFSQDSGRWSVFRIGPEGHNLLRFSGAMLQVEGKATIIQQRDGATVLDLTPAYAGQVTSYRRGVKLLADRSVMIQDEWTSEPQPVAFQWLTNAQATIEGRTVTLSQRGQSLQLIALEPGDLRWELQDTAALLQPHDAPNKSLSRLVGHTRTPPSGIGRLAILALPGNVAMPSHSVVRPFDLW